MAIYLEVKGYFGELISKDLKDINMPTYVRVAHR